MTESGVSAVATDTGVLSRRSIVFSRRIGFGQYNDAVVVRRKLERRSEWLSPNKIFEADMPRATFRKVMRSIAAASRLGRIVVTSAGFGRLVPEHTGDSVKCVGDGVVLGEHGALRV